MSSGRDGPPGVEHLDPILHGGSGKLGEQSCSGLLLTTQVPTGREKQQDRERNIEKHLNKSKEQTAESISVIPWPFTNDANHLANLRENYMNI